MIEIVLGTVAVGVVCLVLAFGLILRTLRRRLRLVSNRANWVPLAWLVHPGRPAQLHRRLRSACQTVTALVGAPTRLRHPSRRHQPSSPLARVGAELVDQALGLDARIVIASRLTGPHRRSTLYELAAEVRSVEAAVQRIGQLDSVWKEHQRSLGPGSYQPSLELRLDALEAAMAELRITPPPG